MIGGREVVNLPLQETARQSVSGNQESEVNIERRILTLVSNLTNAIRQGKNN